MLIISSSQPFNQKRRLEVGETSSNSRPRRTIQRTDPDASLPGFVRAVSVIVRVCYSVPKAYTVVKSYFSPAFSSQLGKFAWLGASGKSWVSRHRASRF